MPDMHIAPAAVHAVFATLVRATVDHRTTVVLRAPRPAQAAALARWLTAAHGSQRLVIASRHTPAEVEVRLPARLVWPPVPRGGQPVALPQPLAAAHLSSMSSLSLHEPR